MANHLTTNVLIFELIFIQIHVWVFTLSFAKRFI